MGANSVTGKGPGSSEGLLRMFNNLDWTPKIRNLNANQISSGQVNDRFPLFLQYTETPGAATANLVLATTNGTFANIRYIITKIG